MVTAAVDNGTPQLAHVVLYGPGGLYGGYVTLNKDTDWIDTKDVTLYVDENGIREEIARTWKEDKYLMDTHTAVASAVLRAYQQETGDKTVSVIVSTASPYKFGASVLEAVAGSEACQGKDDFACCDALCKLSGLSIPDSIAKLPELPVRHNAVCEKQAMAQAVMDAVK